MAAPSETMSWQRRRDATPAGALAKVEEPAE
jgi:hypothetical protein